MMPSGEEGLKSDKPREIKSGGKYPNREEAASALKVLKLEKPEATAIIALHGFLQRKEAIAIMKTLSSLQDDGVLKVVFDMSEVEYANSSAISAFVNSASSLKAAGGYSVLLAMRPNVRNVFETLGLLGLFRIAATREEALNKS
jgi:anti-anti-sigma factor